MTRQEPNSELNRLTKQLLDQYERRIISGLRKSFPETDPHIVASSVGETAMNAAQEIQQGGTAKFTPQLLYVMSYREVINELRRQGQDYRPGKRIRTMASLDAPFDTNSSSKVLTWSTQIAEPEDSSRQTDIADFAEAVKNTLEAEMNMGKRWARIGYNRWILGFSIEKLCQTEELVERSIFIELKFAREILASRFRDSL